jgi:glycosyltransferase involved in cell wall biosynthesis
VVADNVRDDLVRHFAIAVDRITIVPNPIDVARIRRAGAESVEKTDTNHGAVAIVGVGRLVRLKGFDVLIRAFARLPASIPAKLQIVGDGEERAGLERLAAELKVGNRVEFLGTQMNPWKYMARAGVIALPSRSEASPNVLGEALALAIPVVATRCSDGVVTYLEDGRCGLLVPPDDAIALGDALERILTDDTLRRRLIERAGERAETFDLPPVVDRYERVIMEATGG